MALSWDSIWMTSNFHESMGLLMLLSQQGRSINHLLQEGCLPWRTIHKANLKERKNKALITRSLGVLTFQCPLCPVTQFLQNWKRTCFFTRATQAIKRTKWQGPKDPSALRAPWKHQTSATLEGYSAPQRSGAYFISKSRKR